MKLQPQAHLHHGSLSLVNDKQVKTIKLKMSTLQEALKDHQVGRPHFENHLLEHCKEKDPSETLNKRKICFASLFGVEGTQATKRSENI